MTRTFSLSGIPLPPPDNKLVKHGRYGTYATADYQDWFLKTRSLLLDALEYQEIDTSEWWKVEIKLRLGKSDGPNHTKAILDWLTGRYALERATEIGGVKRSKGAIIIGRGLWDDDRRVKRVDVEVLAVRCAEPSFSVECWAMEPPIDEAATAKALALRAKDEARAAAKAAREEEKAKIKAASAAAKEQAREGREAAKTAAAEAAKAAKEQARAEAEAEIRTKVRQALELLAPANQLVLSRFSQLSEGVVRRALTDMQLCGEVHRTGKGWVLG